MSDFTDVASWSGTVYVAFVIDVRSRLIVGWRAATSMGTELVLDALEMAIWRRVSVLEGSSATRMLAAKADSTGRRNISTVRGCCGSQWASTG